MIESNSRPSDENLFPHRLGGDMPFVGLSATVSDFWKFALGDSRTNNLRGYLAEFLVREAIRSISPRVEWDEYDLEDLQKVKIEVKSIGYVQAWAPSEVPAGVLPPKSTPPARFTGLQSKKLLAANKYAKVATYNADVYVFCEETEKREDHYRPLDLSQWAFHVLSKRAISDTKQKTISITRVRSLTEPTPYSGLAGAITLAARELNLA